jgi:predicted ribosomally synthesized peptide with nif11-like leader
MSEEQLSAFLAKLEDDVGLQRKLKGAADLDAVAAIAKEAGFEVSKGAWDKYQAKKTFELSDEELEGAFGGKGYFKKETRIDQGCLPPEKDTSLMENC